MTSTTMLEMIRTAAREQGGGRHHGQVTLGDRLEAPQPDAVDVEDRLGEDRTREQGAEVDSEDRDDGHQRGTQGVLVDHGVVPQSLGLRRADVVLVEHLDHRPAGVAGVGGAPEGAQRQPGEGHPAEPLRWVLGDREVAGVGEEGYLPADGQEQPCQQGEQVVGDGRDDQEARHERLVGHCPASSGRGDADGDAEGQVEERAADGHRERGGHALLHLLEHRSLGPVGVAQARGRALEHGGAAELDLAPGHDTLHELAVLLVPRVVEAEVLAEHLEPRGCAAVAGVVVADRLGGLGRSVPEEQEHAHRDEEQDDHAREQALDDIGEHEDFPPRL